MATGTKKYYFMKPYSLKRELARAFLKSLLMVPVILLAL